MSDDPKYQLSVAEDDPEIIRLLGIITARWASLDSVLERLLGKLLNNRHAANVIYYSLESFGARLDVITNLVVETMAGENGIKKETVTLLNRLNRLSRVRNKLIHTQIIGEPDKLMHDRQRPGRSPRNQRHPVKANDLLQHANALVEVAWDLSLITSPELVDQLVEQIRKNPELWPQFASPDKPPQP